MPAAEVVIVAAGVVTPVGVSLPEAAAAVRSGTARFTESPFHDRNAKPLVMALVPEDALPPLHPDVDVQDRVSSRERRMVRLAAQAFAQCAKVLPKTARTVPVSIAVPNVDGTVGIDRKRFVERLSIQTGVPLATGPSLAHQHGRAGGLLALDDARALLLRGVAQYVIAGGVDSYRDASVIARLDAVGRIKSESNRDAFIPGEAAALLLVTTATQAARDGLAALAAYSSIATAFEEGHLLSSTPYRGDAVAAAIAQLASRGEADHPIAEVYSSMNGEHHWGREWSIAFMRQRALFDPAHEFHHPADAYGDVGTAAGPMLVALTAIGQQQRYRRSPALVYCSSDDGPRAAMLVFREPNA